METRRETAAETALKRLAATLPLDWRDGLASLSRMAVPDGMGAARWEGLVGDAVALAEDWGELARGLGWDAVALFGHDPDPLARRLDTAGLVALLDGRPVVALDAGGATILSADGNRTRFRRQPFPGSINPAAGSVPLWRVGEQGREPWTARREHGG